MKYHYWNKTNFESLSQLAITLRETPELVRLAEYCELREKGLRKQALAAVRTFLAETTAFPEERRLALSMYLLDLHYATPEAHQFLSQPLIDGLIRLSLRKAARPGNAAFRYLALFLNESGRGKNALRVALKYTPVDVLVRKRLISRLLGEVVFAMHHLEESVFIGSEGYCLAVLDEAGRLLDPTVADATIFRGLWEDRVELSMMLGDWMEYTKKNSALSFPEWCMAKGREYYWCAKFYYKE